MKLCLDEKLTIPFNKLSACDRGMSGMLRLRKIPDLSATDADHVEVWTPTINWGGARQLLNLGPKCTEIANW